MTKRIVTTTKGTGRLRSTSATSARVDPEAVRKALGAERVAHAARAGGPSLLAALRRELMASLKSSGGRPGLEGAVRRQKVPMTDEDWSSLERIAESMRRDGVSATAGQVAGQLLRDAIANLLAHGASYPAPADPRALRASEAVAQRQRAPDMERDGGIAAEARIAALERAVDELRSEIASTHVARSTRRGRP